ncbi:MAG: hypothetical protein Ta2B_09250 [Termitinemataceae bacterium]|nr:MAG: hypothetical protein Ta2B_09250 [Termitinemataceae bacterium]
MDEAANLANEMGGSGAPANEAPVQSGSGTGTEGTPAWTNQLSKELRDDASFSKLANFKKLDELALAYLKGGGSELSTEELLNKLGVPKPDEPYGIEDKLGEEMQDFLKAARETNLSKKQAEKLAETYQTMMQNYLQKQVDGVQKAVTENSKELVDEFGAEATSWWKKAASAEKGLKEAIAKAGLGSSKALMRALVLLGRETSEESTPDGGRHGSGAAKTWAEGGGFKISV